MKLALVLILMFSSLAFSSQSALQSVIGKELLENRNLQDYEQKFGKAHRAHKELQEFKQGNHRILVYSKNKKVYQLEYKFFKSNHKYKNLKSLLSEHTLLKKESHDKGRKLYFKKSADKKEELIVFNNNSQKTLNSIVVMWKD
ncbi:MAG: hypothetical protein WD025_04425 [Bacteriovoracaceae bacterium]